MRLAFYAPLKSPQHGVPSGDRAMALGLVTALEEAGHDVTLAADLRSRDGAGDADTQRRIMAEAEGLLPDLVARGRREGWGAWITYHNYYKAPDLLGPAVTRALKIPYLLVEATRARKRLGGPWDSFARAAEAATDAADVVFYLTESDRQALAAYAPPGQVLLHLRPFLHRHDLPPPARGDTLLAVGMMRVAAKSASYALIARTLALCPDAPLLEIVGDGPARDRVEQMMATLGARVRFLGALAPAAVDEAFARARLMIWPGVDEAFGMVYLEAQAHGLPVVAQDRDGVRDVLFPRAYPSVAEGAAGLARLLQDTLNAPPDPEAIRDHIRAHHLLHSAVHTLAHGLALAGVVR
ncbi:glycosyltransferase family 4 protein [Sulfitobacter sp. HNIBRBA3233]|uniref:glycosyltransferase family 4 protein n=1 Tax=Sulfitobacter marinivivus TaxID=3158558 RepID=UPI0032DFB611